MNYQITVTKTEPNPNYAEEMEQRARDRNYYGPSYDQKDVRPDFIKDCLIVELTEAQYEAVKKAVLATFGTEEPSGEAAPTP